MTDPFLSLQNKEEQSPPSKDKRQRFRQFMRMNRKWIRRTKKHYSASKFRGMGRCMFAAYNTRNGLWAVSDNATTPRPSRRSAYKTLNEAHRRFIEIEPDTGKEMCVGAGLLLACRPLLSVPYINSIVYSYNGTGGRKAWSKDAPIAVIMYGSWDDNDEYITSAGVVLGTRDMAVIVDEFHEPETKDSINKAAELVWHWFEAYERGECFDLPEDKRRWEPAPPSDDELFLFGYPES